MNSNKLCNALGLCRRAGKCIVGDFACEKAIKAGRAALVVVDAAASEATQARYRGFCERADAPMCIVQGAGHAIGRADSRIIAIMDAGFAGMIQRAAEEMQSTSACQSAGEDTIQ